tara:strand:- start:120 stop:389 length:270 start_codon:yes stop_codon:yes gene_type:complete
MSYDYDDEKYDCIDPEWEEECSRCGNTFTNQGLHGIDCPHCEEEDDDDEDEERTEYLAYCTVCRGSYTSNTRDEKDCPHCVNADECKVR